MLLHIEKIAILYEMLQLTPVSPTYLRHVWSGPDFSSLGLIAELLCVKRQYIELPGFQVDELDKLIAFLCCN